MPRTSKHSRPAQGARLYRYRARLGLTQAQVAGAIGERQENISYWERSEKPPSSDVLPALAAVLGVSISQLLGVRGSKPRSGPLPSRSRLHRKLNDAFEKVENLPRKKQRLVLNLIEGVLAQSE